VMYADVCWRLTVMYADVCWRMTVMYADVCWRMTAEVMASTKEEGPVQTGETYINLYVSGCWCGRVYVYMCGCVRAYVY
jgi:hypothetical protein